MTTRLYTDAANGFWSPFSSAWGDLDVNSGTFHLVAIDVGIYVFDEDAHTVLADIPSGARLGDTVITGIAVAARGLTFDPVTWDLVPAGPDIGAVVVYKEGTSDADAPLLLYSDDSADLPATPDGTDVTYTPGAGGIAIL